MRLAMEGNLSIYIFLLGPFKVGVHLMLVELVNFELLYIWLNVGGHVVSIKILSDRSSKFRGIVLINSFHLCSSPFL